MRGLFRFLQKKKKKLLEIVEADSHLLKKKNQKQNKTEINNNGVIEST